MRHCFRQALVLLVAIVFFGSPERAQNPPVPKQGPPAAATAPAPQADQSRFAPLDALLKDAVEKGATPGAVLLVGHNGAVVYRKAFGYLETGPDKQPMTTDAIFDLASLTKVMATTSCVMRMVQLGEIKLNDPVAKYIPDFGQNGKQEVTVRQLLTHYSGLRADLALTPYWRGTEEAYARANGEKLINLPGSTFLYSDINFIVLGELVQRVSGMAVDEYSEKYIFGPLGMTMTRFNPPKEWLARIAPTEHDPRTGAMLRGMVHDPSARLMGGVAGHAGLFSTADDVAKFAQALLNGGAPVLSPLIVEKMTTPQQPPNMTIVRGLGWDIDSPFSSNRGDLLPVGSFGHTGFTGTSLWIDPTTNSYIVLLTNAVNLPTGNVVALRTEVATAVAAALQLTPTEEQTMRLARITGYNEAAVAARRVTARNGQVLTGIDVLEQSDFEALRVSGVPNPRVGLLTNQTGLDSHGRRTIDVLARARALQLTALFSPEHGINGTAEVADPANLKDGATGVPIYGVYGDTDAKRRPPANVVSNLDVLVVDVQDPGVRFSSYESTLGYFLEAAAKAGKKIVVLDRPNPLTGAYVQGPLSDAGQQSLPNYFALPPRHAMTIGELAKLFNSERHINANLTVVPMRGWMRGDWFDSTGQAWVNPSLDLRTPEQELLYAGVGLVAPTNVSVGYGTDAPFQQLGAPWIDAQELATYLNKRKLPGLRFLPTTFTPLSGNYARQQCSGVRILITNREEVDVPELGIELAAALHRLSPVGFDLEPLARLLANQAVYSALQAGEDARHIADEWRDGLQQFMELRSKYLLY